MRRCLDPSGATRGGQRGQLTPPPEISGGACSGFGGALSCLGGARSSFGGARSGFAGARSGLSGTALALEGPLWL